MSPPLPSWPWQVAAIVRKDLAIEWRGRGRLNAVAFFAVLALLLFSFAVGPEPQLLTRLTPGFLWLALLLASVLDLGEAMRQETEAGALEGLRLLPVRPSALFVGKALASSACLFALGVVLTPIAIALYGAELAQGPLALAGVLVLGAGAVSAPGTLYAALAADLSARDVLLPLLLFPVLTPALLGAVRATACVVLGDPMGELRAWMALLVAFNALYWLLGAILFGRVVEP